MDKIASFLDRVVRFIQVKILPGLITMLLRFVLWTNKIEVIGLEQFYEKVKQHPSIIILWHNRVVLGPNFFGDFCAPTSNYTAYVSHSRDGEWLALAIESFKNGFTIRVPKRNKHESLRAFIKTLKTSILLITPDGPKGPKYKIKPGVIFAASTAKAQLFPFSWSASKYWQLKSWDKLKVPKPFGRIVIGLGEPFFLHTEENMTLEQKTLKAENTLNAFRQFLNDKIAYPNSEPQSKASDPKAEMAS
jgi:lysophospholipid acyltransferase (LPLAT)-like uncharacterized protein